MKESIRFPSFVIGIIATTLIMVFAFAIFMQRPDAEFYRITPPVFGKAVVVCANLGGLRYFSAARLNPESARVRAICNIGVEVLFQIRYDGKPEGEAK
jgi:hypothetical protein